MNEMRARRFNAANMEGVVEKIDITSNTLVT
jgi:hypothetical protein